MPFERFCLAAQARFDSKWLKTDLQLAFTRDGLCGLWNEMVKDGEIVYTGPETTQNLNDSQASKEDNNEFQAGSKKDDQNDKEKKEEETPTSIIEPSRSLNHGFGAGSQM